MENIRFGFTGSSTAIIDFSKKLGQWWYIFIAAVGSAVVSIAASLATSYDFQAKLDTFKTLSGLDYAFKYCLIALSSPWFWLIIGIFMMMYGGKGTFDDQKNLNDENLRLKNENQKVAELREQINSISEDSELLQNDLADLQVKLVITWLKGSSRQLKLNTKTRVTIYYYVQEHFYLLARYSTNPILAEVHRQKFPRNQGVISKAWEHGFCVDTNEIPDYHTNKENYNNYMNATYGYSEVNVDKLTMKSCQYVAIAITEADRNIGVIVFETEQKGYFTKSKVTEIKRFCTTYQGYMVDFINGGVKYDKSVKVQKRPEMSVDEEFINTLGVKV